MTATDIASMTTAEQDSLYVEAGQAGDFEMCELIRSVRDDLRYAYELTLPE